MTETGFLIFFASIIGVSIIAAIIVVIAAVSGAASQKRDDVEE